jgi:hypothetical protein
VELSLIPNATLIKEMLSKLMNFYSGTATKSQLQRKLTQIARIYANWIFVFYDRLRVYELQFNQQKIRVNLRNSREFAYDRIEDARPKQQSLNKFHTECVGRMEQDDPPE